MLIEWNTSYMSYKSAGPFRGIPAVETRTCLLSQICSLLFCLSTSQLLCLICWSAVYRLADLLITGQLISICRSAYLVDVDLLLDPRYRPNQPPLLGGFDFWRVLETLRKSMQKRYPTSDQNGVQKGPQKRSKITKMRSWSPPKTGMPKSIPKWPPKCPKKSVFQRLRHS